MFTSHSALQQIAASAQTARLIAVNRRGHEFVNTETVQQELTHVVQVLSRQRAFLPQSHSQLTAQQYQHSVLGHGCGWNWRRNVIAQRRETCLVGSVFGGTSPRTIARSTSLFHGQSLIQSEVALSLLSESESNLSILHGNKYQRHCCRCRLLIAVIDKSRGDYHKQMAAGILALADGDDSVMVHDTTTRTQCRDYGGTPRRRAREFSQYLLGMDTNAARRLLL
jgi:hypothetical protein